MSNSAKVLVIDDDPGKTSLIREVLELRGLEVQTAATGREGIHKSKEFVPDIIVLDLNLPDMKGHDVSMALRDDPRLEPTPILMVTNSKVGSGERILGFRSGVDDYVSAPVDFSEMAERVQVLLRRVWKTQKKIKEIEDSKASTATSPSSASEPRTPDSSEAKKDSAYAEFEEEKPEKQPPSSEASAPPPPTFEEQEKASAAAGFIPISEQADAPAPAPDPLSPQAPAENATSRGFFEAIFGASAAPIRTLSTISENVPRAAIWTVLLVLTALEAARALPSAAASTRITVVLMTFGGVLASFAIPAATGYLLAPFAGGTLSWKHATAVSGLALAFRVWGALAALAYFFLVQEHPFLFETELQTGFGLLPGVGDSLQSAKWLLRIGFFDFVAALACALGTARVAGTETKKRAWVVGAVFLAAAATGAFQGY